MYNIIMCADIINPEAHSDFKMLVLIVVVNFAVNGVRTQFDR